MQPNSAYPLEPDLKAVEARALQSLLWPEAVGEGETSLDAHMEAGFPLAEGSAVPGPEEWNAWQEGMLGPLTMAALWDEAALPVLQALAEGSGQATAWGAEPPLEQLRALLKGQEVALLLEMHMLHGVRGLAVAPGLDPAPLLA